MTNLNDDSALSLAVKRSSREGNVVNLLVKVSLTYNYSFFSSSKCNRGLPFYASPTTKLMFYCKPLL